MNLCSCPDQETVIDHHRFFFSCPHRSTKTHPGPVVHLSDSPKDEGKVGKQSEEELVTPLLLLISVFANLIPNFSAWSYIFFFFLTSQFFRILHQQIFWVFFAPLSLIF